MLCWLWGGEQTAKDMGVRFEDVEAHLRMAKYKTSTPVLLAVRRLLFAYCVIFVFSLSRDKK